MRQAHLEDQVVQGLEAKVGLVVRQETLEGQAVLVDLARQAALEGRVMMEEQPLKHKQPVTLITVLERLMVAQVGLVAQVGQAVQVAVAEAEAEVVQSLHRQLLDQLAQRAAVAAVGLALQEDQVARLVALGLAQETQVHLPLEAPVVMARHKQELISMQ